MARLTKSFKGRIIRDLKNRLYSTMVAPLVEDLDEATEALYERMRQSLGMLKTYEECLPGAFLVRGDRCGVRFISGLQACVPPWEDQEKYKEYNKTPKEDLIFRKRKWLWTGCNWQDTYVPRDWKESEKFLECSEFLESAEAQHKKVSGDMEKVVNACKTVKQLREAWPTIDQDLVHVSLNEVDKSNLPIADSARVVKQFHEIIGDGEQENE